MENNGSGSLSIQDSAAFDGLIGKTVANNFRLVKRIGSGAMGRVYQAEQLSLGKMVAIKILRHELMADEKLLRRFELEARTASAVSHPNLVETFDCGRDRTLDLAYIAMELLQGPDLSQVIARESPISLQRSARIMDQVLAALEEAHLQGIVHRDLKPGNIMLVPRRDEADFVKVCDFGIAKVKSVRARPSLTMAGFVFGTPEYMSPEQACGAEVDARTDLYAVAAILYYLVSGELPFPAPSPTEVLARILRDEPERPSARGYVVVPTPIEDLIMRGLEKNPDKRPQSATEFRVLLRDAWADVIDYWPGQSPGSPTMSLRAPTPPASMPGVVIPERSSAPAPKAATPIVATAPAPAPAVVPAPAAAPASPSAGLINWSVLRGRRPTWAATLGFSLTLACGGAALLYLNSDHGRDPLAPPSRPGSLNEASSARSRMIVVPRSPSASASAASSAASSAVSPSLPSSWPSDDRGGVDRGGATARAPAAPAHREAPSRASQRIALRGKGHHESEPRGAPGGVASSSGDRVVAARGASAPGGLAARSEPAPSEAPAGSSSSRAESSAPSLPPLTSSSSASTSGQSVLHKLRATSIPSEAEVALDGKVVGRTPLFGTEVDINQAHTLTIRKDGYAPYEQVITAASGWVLRPADNAAALRVAAVLKKVDRSYVSPIALPSDDAKIASTQGAGAPSAAVLAATSYKLRITSIPSEAEVWIDGRSVGHTPLFGADIDMTRSHRMVIRKEGYAAYEQVISTTSEWSIKPSDRSAALLRISALLRRGDPTLAQRPGSGQ